MTIDTAKTYQATIETAKGNIVMELDPKTAPVTSTTSCCCPTWASTTGCRWRTCNRIRGARLRRYRLAGQAARQRCGLPLALEPTAAASQVVTGTVSMYPVPDPATGQPLASGSQFFISFTTPSPTPGHR